MDTVVRNRSTAVVIGGLVVGLVAVGIVFAAREPDRAEPGTPEATAQGYFQAFVDSDYIAAETLLTDDLLARCDERYSQFRDTGTGLRVVIIGTTVRGTTATVIVSITETFDDNPLSQNSHTFDEVLVMESAGDHWLISAPPWPLHCQEG